MRWTLVGKKVLPRLGRKARLIAWGGGVEQTECRTGTPLKVLLLISLGTCLEVLLPVPVALQWVPL